MYSIEDTKIPIGVKIVALWCYFFGSLCTVLFFFSIYFMIEGSPEYLLTVTLLLLSALNYVSGRGLWKGRNWGRIIAVILHGSMLLATLIAMSTRYIYLVAFPWGDTYIPYHWEDTYKNYFWRVNLYSMMVFVLFGTIIIYLLSNKVSQFFGRVADDNSSTR